MSPSPAHLALNALLIAASVPLASNAAAAPRTYTIVIDKLKFGPAPAEVHKGDVLIWSNHDILRHSATAANHAFDVDLPPGASKRMALTKSGIFPFFCRYHPGMRGSISVQ